MPVALSDVGGQLIRDGKRNYPKGSGGYCHEESDSDGKTVTKNLTRMDGHFGADIALNKPGEYRFT